MAMRLLLLPLLLFAFSVPSMADDAADAMALIEKGVKAVGGKEALEKCTKLTFEENGTYYGMGQALPYSGKYAVEYPSKFRMEIEGIFVTVQDGEKAWVSSQGSVMEITGDRLQYQLISQYAGYVTTLLPLLSDKSYTLSTVTDANDVNVAGVNVAKQGMPDVKLYFRKDNGQLVRSSYIGPHPDTAGKMVTYVHNASNYVKVGDAMLPGKMAMTIDGEKFIEAEMSKYEQHDTLDPKLFKLQ